VEPTLGHPNLAAICAYEDLRCAQTRRCIAPAVVRFRVRWQRVILRGLPATNRDPIRTLRVVTIERCDECGFDGSAWTDTSAVLTVSGLPDQWRAAVAGLDTPQIELRSIDQMWSIGEYTDHVRETVFACDSYSTSHSKDTRPILASRPNRSSAQSRNSSTSIARSGRSRTKSRNFVEHYADPVRNSGVPR
jgi:hypothetical protein